MLDGANAFAIESEDGEWEIVQARDAVLVDINTYELSGFLRGRQGSGQAMRSPHPVGTRIVVLDARLGRIEIGAHEWGEVLTFLAPPAGAPATDPRAAAAALSLPHAAARPWGPAQLRAVGDAGGDVTLSWVRCARIGGDYWGPGEPPLDTAVEGYQLEIMEGSLAKRTVVVSAASYLYTAAEQTADFGGPVSTLSVRVAQLDDSGAPGLKTAATLPL